MGDRSQEPMFHEKFSCNKCGKETNDIIKVKNSINYDIAECETKCSNCGFKDYWAYGYFQSGAQGYDNCTKY